jgi:hypothetical protein
MPTPSVRRFVASLLPAVILLAACASTVPRAPVTSLDPAGLSTLHRALDGQPATVVLAGGETAREVEDVEVGAETTSWREGDRARSVPTSQVCQVVRQIRFRAGKGYAWGTLACAPLAWGVGQAQRDPLAGLGAVLLVEGLCPLIGLFVAAGLKQPADRVVYASPSCGPAL